jgi:hypothetical protein
VAFRTARELVANWYGDELVSDIAESDFSVGTSALLVAKRNGATIWRAISNNGAATIYVSSKPGLAVNQGIAVAAGGIVSFNAVEDFDLVGCDLYAISSGAANAVHVIHLRLIGGN